MSNELKARIKEEIVKMTDFFDSVDDIYTAQSVIDEENSHLRFILALLFAVERHGEKVISYNGELISICDGCTNEAYTLGEMITYYPCTEYKRIAEILGIQL